MAYSINLNNIKATVVIDEKFLGSFSTLHLLENKMNNDEGEWITLHATEKTTES